MSKANAVAVALLVHLVQVVWTIVGFGTLAIGRAKIGRRSWSAAAAPSAASQSFIPSP